MSAPRRLRNVPLWMVGAGAVAGALAGFAVLAAVEYDESASPASALVFGLPGLLAGTVFGLVVAWPTAFVLLGLQRRGTPRGVRVALTTLTAGGLSALIVFTVSGFTASPDAVLVCAAAAAVVAGGLTVWLDRPCPAGAVPA